MITIHIEVDQEEFKTEVSAEGTEEEMMIAVTQIELVKHKLILALMKEAEDKPPLEGE